MPDCRRLVLRRHRRSPRGATRCFGGPGASATNGSTAEGEGARSLSAREANRQGRSDCAPLTAGLAGKTAVEATTRAANPKPRTGQVGGGTAAGGPGEAKDTGYGERGVGDSDRTVVLFVSDPEEQKLRFQGADHSAALRGPFPPGSWRVGWAGLCASGRRAPIFDDMLAFRPTAVTKAGFPQAAYESDPSDNSTYRVVNRLGIAQ